MIKIALTDDHPLVIDGLITAFGECTDIQIIGSYTTACALLQGLEKSLPDVLLLDLQLPDKNGSELVPLLLKQYPELKILILSGIESLPYIKDMMQKGCSGYMLKSQAGKNMLIAAVREVYNGGMYLEPSIKEHLLHDMLLSKRKADKLHPRVTQREKEVLLLIKSELSNQEIADRLFISLRTVETHRYNLLQKLNVKNTAGLLRAATEMGLM